MPSHTSLEANFNRMGELGHELRTDADVDWAAQEAGLPPIAFKVGQTVMFFDRPEPQRADMHTDPAQYLGVEFLPD